MDELVEACKDGRLSDVERLLADQDNPLDPGQKDESGWCPLHYASQRGHLPVVEYLLRKGCDPSCETTLDKTTPLHLSCANERVDVALRLLEVFPQGAPLRKTKDGNTILHLACKVGNASIVRAILVRSRAMEYAVTNHYGTTPFGICTALALSASSKETHLEVTKMLLDKVFGNPAKQIKDFQSLFPSMKPKRSLDHPIKIFALGDPQSGKSTLVKALQGESTTKQFRGYALVNVYGVDGHKVGLVPTDFTSRLINARVILYDIASSHDFINENLIQSEEDLATSIFIVCVAMKEDRKDISEKMFYWMSFVHHQCARYCSTQRRPSVAIVGSFWDVPRLFSLVPAQRLHLEYNEMVRDVEFSSRFNLLRKFSLDCRKEGSIQIHQLRSALKRYCQTIRRSVEDSTPCRLYILSATLESEFPTNPAIQFHELKAKVSKRSSQSGLLALLPETTEQLWQLCQCLAERERVVLIKPKGRTDVESTWILHRSRQLLTQIDTALASAPATELPGSPVIITRDDLEGNLSSLRVDFDTLLQVMEHFCICEAITVPELSSEQLLYYIPGLLKKQHEVQSWERDSSYKLTFAWAVVPADHLEFFMPRFLKLLLLSLLAFTEAAEFKTRTVWSEGICCSNDQSTVNICVSVSRRCIVLTMRCKPRHEIICLAYRNQILERFRRSKDKYQPQIQTDEVIVLPTPKAKFPLQDIQSHKVSKINVAELKKELLEGPDHAKGMLPFFEPYLCLCKLSETQTQSLTSCAHSSQLGSKEVVAALVKCFGQMWKVLADYFEFPQLLDSDTSSSEPGSALNDQQQEVYGELDCGYLMECLASISIFESSHLTEALQGTSLAWKSAVEGLHVIPHPSPPLSTGSSSVVSHNFPPLATGSVSSSKSSGLNSCTPPADTRLVPATSSGSISSHSSCELTTPDPGPVHAERKLTSSLRTTQHSSAVMQHADTVQVVHCDSIGGWFSYEPHDVILSVPEGATDSVANIEVGVTLTGPMIFPRDTKPVSAIVMLCLQEGSTLSKAVKLVFPHCYRYTEGDQHMLTFLKASKPKKPGRKLLFQKINGTIARGKGMLWMKPSKPSPSFFCIGCKVGPEAIAKTNYCVVKVMPKSTDETTWQLVLCISYLLQTSIEMVRRQFGDEFMTSFQPFMFEVTEDRDPFIAVHFERFQSSRWSLTVDGANEVAARDVDFSTGESQVLIDSSLYPPRFNLIVSGERATEDHVAVLTFSGTQKLLQMEVALLLPAPAGGHFRTASISSLGSFDHEDPFRPLCWSNSLDRSGRLDRKASVSSTRSGFSSSSGGVGLAVPKTVASRMSVSPPMPQGTLVPGHQGWAPPELYRTSSHWSISSNISEPAYSWSCSPPNSHAIYVHPVLVRSKEQSQPKLADLPSTIMERHLVVITENLKLDLARPYLRQHKVLTKDEHMQLIRNPDVELLVDILEQKGEEGARRFISMLEATSGKVPEHKLILRDLVQDEHYSVIVNKVPVDSHESKMFRFASRFSIN